VYDHQEAEPPAFAEAEVQVRQEWESDKRKQLNEQFVASMIARYEVIIEDDPSGEKAKDPKEQTQ
jgi:hypothetical protein